MTRMRKYAKIVKVRRIQILSSKLLIFYTPLLDLFLFCQSLLQTQWTIIINNYFSFSRRRTRNLFNTKQFHFKNHHSNRQYVLIVIINILKYFAEVYYISLNWNKFQEKFICYFSATCLLPQLILHFLREISRMLSLIIR